MRAKVAGASPGVRATGSSQPSNEPARQPWCGGAMGVLGRSCEGAAQWHVAAADPYGAWTYPGGAFRLGFCPYRVPADLLHGQA
ncbi:hypothetical protein OG226_02110 [Streptomyces sp. NBC_01261]|uniref:hypothetical protein n=1 Tax=Streptomyces sp. NBC_01261 TaxID=2903802 RepID=UPI002E34ABDE|nr:hypothetical protein [Streptomyces sp. NBC_01261]